MAFRHRFDPTTLREYDIRGVVGRTLSAKQKRVERRRLLEEAGLVTGDLPSLDDVDAALCAVAAQQVIAGRFKAYGEPSQGFILVPSSL